VFNLVPYFALCIVGWVSHSIPHIPRTKGADDKKSRSTQRI